MTFPTLSTHSHLALCQMEPHLTLRTILIVHGTHSTRCWKQSSENLVHIIIIASHCCCRFVGCTSMMWITCFSADRSGNCSNICVCVHKCSSVSLDCNEWLFEILLPFYRQFNLFSLTSGINEVFSPWELHLTWYFVYKPCRWLCSEFQTDLNHLSFRSHAQFHHAYMPKCTELLTCDWLILYLL